MEYGQSGVRLIHANWDKEREMDFLTGKGFPVTDAILSSDDEKTEGGLASPKFATDWEDDHAFAERYTCKCKHLKGQVYEGEICPECGTPVEFRDVEIDMTAWIMLKGNYIIHPIFFKILESFIGKKELPTILEYNPMMTLDGTILEVVDKKKPYFGIGLYTFKERFEEIIMYYAEKKKKDKNPEKIKSMTMLLLANKDAVFASSIPAYTTILRPVVVGHESIFHASINRRYSNMYELSVLLTDATAKKKSRRKIAAKDNAEILYSIQKELTGDELATKSAKLKRKCAWDMIFDEINSKEGHIRDQILGGRVNFSARNVIIPDPHLRADEIRIGYTTFLELYKHQIINLLTKMHDITPYRAHDIWFQASVRHDEEMYHLMLYMVKKLKPHVFINRNPTINYGSLLTVRIVDIKKNLDDDYTMSLPLQILPALNADFDGDVLNIVALQTKELVREFNKGFNPRNNMYISRNDGLFNGSFNLYKDQLIGLFEFNNI